MKPEVYGYVIPMAHYDTDSCFAKTHLPHHTCCCEFAFNFRFARLRYSPYLSSGLYFAG